MKDQWWLWVFPGIILVTLIIGVNLIGEGLNDAVDPKSNVKFNRAVPDRKNLISSVVHNKLKNNKSI